MTTEPTIPESAPDDSSPANVQELAPSIDGRDRELVIARMEYAALKAGTEVSDAIKDYLNPDAFMDTDGRPDQQAIDGFVQTLRPAERPPLYAQNIGLGPQGGGGSPLAVTSRDQLYSMSPQEIVQAAREGRINIPREQGIRPAPYRPNRGGK